MLRNEIKEEDKWDLTKFFENNEEYDKLYQETWKLGDKIAKFKGKIMKNSKNLEQFLELENQMSLNLEKIYVYSYLDHYSNQMDEEGKKLKLKADQLEEELSLKTSFVRSEMLQVDFDYVKKLIGDNKKLQKYEFSLEKLFRYKNHTLSVAEEEIVTLAGNAFGTPDNAFSSLDNADVKFAKVIKDGQEMELNHSNYSLFITDKNRDFRKQVFEKYYQFYVDHKYTITDLYLGQVKEDLFYSKVRHYNSPLEMSLYGDNIDVSVYKNLIATIHNSFEPFYRYMKFRKEFLKVDELHMYDMYVDLVKGEARKFTFSEAQEIVLKALSVLGDEYVNDLSQAFKNRWIDRYPNDGKRSGAYQWGAYGVDPYVSLNFEGTEDSVSTMAHELGHAMHSYYSDKTQDYVYAQYPIFLAEIASTVNEVILNDYLIKMAKDDNEKLLYITSFLDKFKGTVYRQTMFAEFEMIIHDKMQNNESLTTDSICDIYYNLNKLYYGDGVVSDDLIRYEWSRVPHFYTSFYVYKYATGFSAALAIASDILQGVAGAKERYLEFLKSGSSKYPLETLKRCGVDMTKKDPILKGVAMFENKLKQAEEILRKEENNGK